MRSINIPNLSVLNRLLKITHNDHSLDYGFLIANIYIIGVYEKVNKKTCNTSITLAITEVVRLCICHGCLAICVMMKNIMMKNLLSLAILTKEHTTICSVFRVSKHSCQRNNISRLRINTTGTEKVA